MSDFAGPEQADGWFEWIGAHSGRIRCKVCGVAGYPCWQTPSQSPNWWGWPHCGEHVWACVCGRRFATRAGLSTHIRATLGAGHVQDAQEIPTFLPKTLPLM